MPGRRSLNILSHTDPRFGGIVASTPELSRALSAEGRYRSEIAAFRLAGERDFPATDVPWKGWPYEHRAWLTARTSREALDTELDRFDMLHIHGLWEAHCAVTSWRARIRHKPYVISAHGMLDPWAVRQKRWKKRIYFTLFERRALEGASCLRALTLAEAEQYRRSGLRQPIAVIPNGIEVPEQVEEARFRNRFPELRGKKVILYLGRLHPKKGVLQLCEAWAEVGRRCPDAHLVVAGPDGDGIRAQLEALLAQYGCNASVTFPGPLSGPDKWSAYRSSWAFVLPSFSEGFSVAILEALGAGTPVVISKFCYFPESIAGGAGLLTEVTPESIAESLCQVLGLGEQERDEMGRRGAILVEEKFSWRRVAERVADLYDWLLGGPQPSKSEILQVK